MKAKLTLQFLVIFSLTTTAQKWTNYNTSNGLANNSISSIAIDKHDNVWLAHGTYKKVSKFDGTNWTMYTDNSLGNGVNTVVIDSDSYPLFGTINNGISKFDGANWFNYSYYNIGTFDNVAAIVIDSLDYIWFGTHDVVAKYYASSFKTYTKSDGLANNDVRSIAIDPMGNKWFGTYGGGVSKFDGTNWYTYTTTDGLASNYIFSIAIDAKGNKWFGTYNGVSKFDGASWTTYLPSHWVNTIAIDAQGNKWFGFGTNGGGVSEFDDVKWTTYNTTNGLTINYVMSIAIDTHGNKWFGTYGGGVSKLEDGISSINNRSSENQIGTFLSTYPNPTTNQTMLVFPVTGEYNLIVYDINGIAIRQLIGLKGEKTLIQTDNLESGIYLFSLRNLNTGYLYNGKFVVVKQNNKNYR